MGLSAGVWSHPPVGLLPWINACYVLQASARSVLIVSRHAILLQNMHEITHHTHMHCMHPSPVQQFSTAEAVFLLVVNHEPAGIVQGSWDHVSSRPLLSLSGRPTGRRPGAARPPDPDRSPLPCGALHRAPSSQRLSGHIRTSNGVLRGGPRTW